MRNHRHESKSDKPSKGVVTNIAGVLQRECPVLLHVPSHDVQTLSEAFNSNEITSEFSNVMGVKRWESQHKNGLHAELKPHSWQEFELIVNKIREHHLEDKLSIAYDNKVIGYRGAAMQVHADDKNILADNWGNGAGAYILFEDKDTRIGMARIFNTRDGHLKIKIPHCEQGQSEVSWKDITPHSVEDVNNNREYTHAGHIAAHEHD